MSARVKMMVNERRWCGVKDTGSVTLTTGPKTEGKISVVPRSEGELTPHHVSFVVHCALWSVHGSVRSYCYGDAAVMIHGSSYAPLPRVLWSMPRAECEKHGNGTESTTMNPAWSLLCV